MLKTGLRLEHTNEHPWDQALPRQQALNPVWAGGHYVLSACCVPYSPSLRPLSFLEGLLEGLRALASTQHIVGTHLSNRLRIVHAFTLSAKVQCNNSLRICSSFTFWLRYNVLKSPNWALVVGIAKQIPRNWYGCRLWWFRMLKTGLRSHQHLLFDHNPFYRRK